MWAACDPQQSFSLSLSWPVIIPGQHAEEAPHVVEDGEGDEGRLGRQPRRGGVHQGVGGERKERHHEDRAVPQKTLQTFPSFKSHLLLLRPR